MDNPALWIALLAALASCFFAAAHHALQQFSRHRLEELFRQRNREGAIDVVLTHRSALLLTTAVARMVSNLIILLALIVVMTRPGERDEWVSLAIAFIAAGLLVAVFGVAIPWSWARYAAEPLIAISLPVLRVIQMAFRPLLAVLHVFDPIVRRLLGVSKEAEEDLSPLEQEIYDVVSEGEKSGLVDEAQKDMIEAVVEFSSTTVEEIMTPRTDVKGVEINASLDEVKQFIADTGHSRFPVYEDDLDHIVGVLYVKDLLEYIGHQANPFDLRKTLRQALLVPESKTIRDLLGEFKDRKVHLAIVLDEYGGTAGLVTIEDILEEIVGEIRDEYEAIAAEPRIHRVDERVFEVDGRVYIDDLNDELDVKLPEDEDYDTVGGFVFSTLGHIPDVGESFAYQELKVTVIDAERTKVNRVRIETAAGTQTAAADPD